MKNKELEKAINYFHQAIKLGYMDEKEIEGLNDEQLIELAYRMGQQGDAQIEAAMEGSYEDRGKI